MPTLNVNRDCHSDSRRYTTGIPAFRSLDPPPSSLENTHCSRSTDPDHNQDGEEHDIHNDAH